MRQEGWLPGYAWCSFFVMAMLNECGVPNNITGWSPSAYNRRDVIYTDGKFVQSYSDKDVLIMTLSYAQFKNKRFKGIGHTGIVDISSHTFCLLVLVQLGRAFIIFFPDRYILFYYYVYLVF